MSHIYGGILLHSSLHCCFSWTLWMTYMCIRPPLLHHVWTLTGPNWALILLFFSSSFVDLLLCLKSLTAVRGQHLLQLWNKNWSLADLKAAGSGRVAVLHWLPVWCQTLPISEFWIWEEMISETPALNIFPGSWKTHSVNWRHWSMEIGHFHCLSSNTPVVKRKFTIFSGHYQNKTSTDNLQM